MKHIKLFLLAVLFLASCTPSIQPPTQTQLPTQTFRPVPTATQTPSPTPTIIPTPTQIGGGSGKVIFTLDKAAFEKIFPDLTGDVNFFTSNADGTDITPITNGLKGTYTIEGISPDGHKALIYCYTSCRATSGSLYIIALDSGINEPFKLAGQASGKWIDNTHIVYSGNGKEGTGIYIVNSDGTNPKKISAALGSIVAIDSTRAYLQSYVKKQFKDETGFLYMYGDFSALSWANLDGSGSGLLESNGKQIITFSQQEEYAFSPDGKSVAWIPAEFGPGCQHWYFIAARIRDGEYTQYAGMSNMSKPYSPDVINIDPSDLGKVIDKDYVKAYARRCFIIYVASLSDIDNPVKVVLMPPDSFFDADFVFGKDYDLTWFPDGSKIALLYRGISNDLAIGSWYHDSPILFSVKLIDQDPKLSVLIPFRPYLGGTITVLGFTPDGQQIMISDQNQNPKTRFLDFQNSNHANFFEENKSISIDNLISLTWLP